MRQRSLPTLLVGLSSLLLATFSARTAAASCDPDGTQASGAVYRICMPAPGSWNGNLVVWAHGYVAFNQPVAIPEDQLRLPDGTSLPELVNLLGYAFATTSYSVNGLAVRQGVADVVDLVNVFVATKGPIGRVYLVGASEGGLVTTLGVEQHPEVFAGGLAACGPIGDFPAEINYFGDFRVIFDVYYPGLIPSQVTQIPPELIANWDAYYQGTVLPTIFAPQNLIRTLEVLRVTGLAFDPIDPANFWTSVERSFRDAFFYNIFATNDGVAKLGGQPFDNMLRVYGGSSNDAYVNMTAKRVAADPAAITEMRAYYDTTGVLQRPLVTLHTLYDQQDPYPHEILYALKAFYSGSLGQLTVLPVKRYGHCNFTPPEVVVAFALMVFRAEGTPLTLDPQALFKDPRSRAEFLALARQQGLTQP